MIEFKTGDLLQTSAEALVNTVNTVGVMGKGIALQFKIRFPKNYKIYKDACKKGEFKTGQVLVVKDGDLMDQKWVINFPTKAHWKSPSKYEYIAEGLKSLVEAIKEHKIKSIAIPPLGCGNGGLDWSRVKQMMTEALSESEAQIIIFEPSSEIKAILQKEEQKGEAKLTPARAMLLYLMFQYESTGEQSSLFVANKLAYFLQRSGENLRLKFEPHHYGPYAVQLNHVLLNLNGTFVKGMEQNLAKPFEPLILEYSKLETVQNFIENELTFEQKQRLKDVVKLISRFESTFSLELLATVDYIISNMDAHSVDAVMDSIKKWSNRKSDLFDQKSVSIAFDRLKDYAENPFELA